MIGIIAIILCSVKIISNRVFCYDTNVAHPHIAQLAVDLYNNNFDPDLTKEEIECILTGAREEDTPTRWLNHFYDPVHNIGLKGVYSSAKSWAENPGKQSSYALGDQSWQRALDDYKNDDKKKAFIELGHVLHLIADMSVPAHTRNDVHVMPGDSYEQFLKNNWDSATAGIVNKSVVKNISSLSSAFDALANYSNNNFYSDDTVEDSEYKKIFVEDYEKTKANDGKIWWLARSNINGGVNYLYKEDRTSGWGDIWNQNYSDGVQKKTMDSSVIIINHTSLLVPEAVGYSAGVIKLFFSEAEKLSASDKNKNLPTFRQNLLGFANLAIGKVVQTAQGIGEAMKVRLGGGSGEVTASENQIISNSPNSPDKIPNNVEIETKIKTETATTPVTPAPTAVVVTPPTTPTVTPEQPTAFAVTPPVTPIVAPVVAVPPTLPFAVAPAPTAPGNSGSEDVKAPAAATSQGGGGGGGTSQTPNTDNQTLQPEAGLPVAETTTPTTTPTSTPDASSPTPTTTLVVTPTTTLDTSNPTPTTTPEIETPTTTPTSTTPIETTTTTPTATTTLDTDNTTPTTTPEIETPTSTPTSTPEIETPTTTPTSTPPIETPTTTPDAQNPTPTTTPVITFPAVVFNEIAWMGTQSNKANDEWIELYNNTDADIDLTGWKLLVSGSAIGWSNTSSIISAHGYYLLERTNDNAVLDVPANAIVTISGGLKNSGEKLVLTNSLGEIVDEVDCSSGWYAGQAGPQYRSMERLSTIESSTSTTNWQTTESIAPKGRPNGGSTLYGSPGYSNTGYWLLQGDVSVMYSGLVQNNSLTLTKANSPYAIDYATFIPAGFTLNIDPGVVLYGVDKTSYINVKGTLNINGTADEPVIFTSALDANYISRNLSTLSGSPQAGDWSRIEIEQGGIVNASNSKFLYGGTTFKKGTGWVYGTKWISQVLRNTGGTLVLDNSEVKNSFVDSVVANRIYNASVWTESPNNYDSTTTISNTIFDTGWTALNFYGQDNGRKLSASVQNSTLQNYQNPEGVIISNRANPTLTNNTYTNNATGFVDLGMFTLDSDYTLPANGKYSFSTLTLNAGKTLTIEPGVDIKISNDITINGSLQANGTVDKPINIMPKNEYWGILLFNNSTSNLSNVNLTKGNVSSARSVMDRGMITVENSNINLDNVVMMDAQRPFQMVYLKDSKTTMKDSVISWTTDYTGIQNIDGIKFSSGTLYLNNTSFNNMDRGIEISDGGLITAENMTLGHFQNISDLNWWPVEMLTM